MSEPTLDAVMDSLIQAIATRDLATTLEEFSTAHEPAVVGSERGEAVRGRATIEAFFRRIYARPGAFRFDFPERSWDRHGEVMWLVADGTVIEPNSTAPKPYRGELLLRRQPGLGTGTGRPADPPASVPATRREAELSVRPVPTVRM